MALDGRYHRSIVDRATKPPSSGKPLIMNGGDENTTALASLDLLETRLRRVEFYITGKDTSERSPERESTSSREQSVQERLERLEDALHRLSSSSNAVRDLLYLCRCRQYC